MNLTEINLLYGGETLRIRRFAGITDATIKLSRMNVFIGPQASGKSVCAKLIFYFRERVNRLFWLLTANGNDAASDDEERRNFNALFPPLKRGEGKFRLEYSFGDIQMTVVQDPYARDFLRIEYSHQWSSLKNSLRRLRSTLFKSVPRGIPAPHIEGELWAAISRHLTSRGAASLANPCCFAPAERGLTLSLRHFVPLLKTADVVTKPLLITLARRYAITRSLYTAQDTPSDRREIMTQAQIARILGAKFEIVGVEETLILEDGTPIPLDQASYGQQVAFPLLLMLAATGRNERWSQHTTFFVEEPEAHLYPTAQREMVHLLCTALDLTSRKSLSQCVLTTHSPYILTALNNLMYGAKAIRENPDCTERIRKILGETDLVLPEHVRAYAFTNGTITSIIDDETGLVLARELDSVSGMLADEFHQIMDARYGDDE